MREEARRRELEKCKKLCSRLFYCAAALCCYSVFPQPQQDVLFPINELSSVSYIFSSHLPSSVVKLVKLKSVKLASVSSTSFVLGNLEEPLIQPKSPGPFPRPTVVLLT